MYVLCFYIVCVAFCLVFGGLAICGWFGLLVSGLVVDLLLVLVVWWRVCCRWLCVCGGLVIAYMVSGLFWSCCDLYGFASDVGCVSLLPFGLWFCSVCWVLFVVSYLFLLWLVCLRAFDLSDVGVLVVYRLSVNSILLRWFLGCDLVSCC